MVQADSKAINKKEALVHIIRGETVCLCTDRIDALRGDTLRGGGCDKVISDGVECE
jgi:hypothetical protein